MQDAPVSLADPAAGGSHELGSTRLSKHSAGSGSEEFQSRAVRTVAGAA